MQNGAGIPILMAVSMILMSGCATKNWVQEYFGTKEAGIDQRFTTVEGKVDQGAQRLDRVEIRVTEEGQRVEGLGGRMNSMEASVGDVRGLATAAQSQANTALHRAEETDSRLTRLWGNRHKRTVVETVDLYFGFDRWDLGDAGQTAMAMLAKELKEDDKLGVELVGYTDPVGPREYNYLLSQRRVETVRRSLVNHGVEVWRIHSVGLGPIADSGVPNDKKRRVTMRLTAFE